MCNRLSDNMLDIYPIKIEPTPCVHRDMVSVPLLPTARCWLDTRPHTDQDCVELMTRHASHLWQCCTIFREITYQHFNTFRLWIYQRFLLIMHWNKLSQLEVGLLVCNTFTNKQVGQQRSLNLSVKIFVESIPNSSTDISGFNACCAFICKLFYLILKVQVGTFSKERECSHWHLYNIVKRCLHVCYWPIFSAYSSVTW